MNLTDYPYPSRRKVIHSTKGMVASSQPLAAQAGLEILKKGGNAVDAAIAVAACLTVVEPNDNGIGGDMFAQIWMNNQLYGLNGSGPAPASISLDKVKKAGHKQMPTQGWIPVTVPGAPSAWAEMSKRFGKLPLIDVLQPAITYAQDGFPISPTIGAAWANGVEHFKKHSKEDYYQHWFNLFAPNGSAPKIGEIWRSPAHAKTLQSIAETYAESFYRGDLADKIDHFSKQSGGYLRKEDLENFKAEWVHPIKVNYRGYDVWEIPPNGQGIVALIALNILKGFSFEQPYSIDTLHKQFEAIKLAFADGYQYVTDSKRMPVKVEDLLSDAYAEERRRLVGESASIPGPGQPAAHDTVYLATADGEGNMVSLIQSNYMGFGSGLAVPGTGISLQNRGSNFSLDPDHPNCLEPNKKTYHTIIPGFLTKNGKAIGPFGVVGGFMQPQGHVQVIMNTIDFNLNPQAALDAPRWQWFDGTTIQMEGHLPAATLQALHGKGHNLITGFPLTGDFGRGQIIWRNEHGVLMGGSEPRTDGIIACW